MNRTILVGLLWFATALTGSAWGLVGQERPRIADVPIRQLIERALEKNHIEGVRVTVEDGRVVLKGRVPSIWYKEKAIEAALEVPDVQSVDSEIEVMRENSDEDLAVIVAATIRNYVFYTIFDDISVEVRNGVVTLRGRVTDGYKVHDIGERVSRIRGVQEVRNEIQLLPNSPNDDQIRRQIASRIYRDPIFWEYSTQSQPPIHIIVENGHVTLTGVVRNEVERRQAEHIARSTFGVFKVENELRVEKR